MLMRYTALIVTLVGFLLLTALYGTITVMYSRLARGGAGLPRRYMPESTGLHVHDVYIELPGGVRVTGNGQKTGTLTWGFLKLPVSHRENVGWLLMFLASVCGVALGAYVWRDIIRDSFDHPGRVR
jgi:hypothetical protein